MFTFVFQNRETNMPALTLFPHTHHRHTTNHLVLYPLTHTHTHTHTLLFKSNYIIYVFSFVILFNKLSFNFYSTVCTIISFPTPTHLANPG